MLEFGLEYIRGLAWTGAMGASAPSKIWQRVCEDIGLLLKTVNFKKCIKQYALIALDCTKSNYSDVNSQNGVIQ